MFDSSLSPQPPLPDRVSFRDGDITLCSLDDQEFTVHKTVLSKASLFFLDMFALPKEHAIDDQPDTIPIDETGEVLDKILRWIYPSAIAPVITSIKEVTSLLQAKEKLQIECYPFQSAVDTFLSKESHPLRAWALALRFDCPEARRAAARRFYQAGDDIIDNAPAEMRMIDAGTFMELLNARKQAIAKAKKIINSIQWKCRDHRASVAGWKTGFDRVTAHRNPLDPETTSELMFQLCAEMATCSDCNPSYRGRESIQARNGTREAVRNILDAVL